jgi:hypothetical protein
VELSNLKMENITSVSNSQRYKMLGNGWTVDVISHIFKNMECKIELSKEEQEEISRICNKILTKLAKKEN